MAATGWTSPTGVWLPVVGAEIRSDKVFVVLRRQQHQATVGGGCCKPGLGRCGGEYLWVYGRRILVTSRGQQFKIVCRNRAMPP